MEDDKKFRLNEGSEAGREGQGSTMSGNKSVKLGGLAKPRKTKTNGGAPSAAAGSIGNAATSSSGSVLSVGSKKRPSSTQGQGFEATNLAGSGDCPLDDDEDLGQHVNHILSQVGSQIQNRIRAKKQKLDKSFQVVTGIMENVVAFQKEQVTQRAKLIEEFQRAAGSLSGKLNEIIQMQHRNEEKQGKMMMAVTRENEEVKQLVSQCSQIQNSIVSKFFKENEELLQQEEQDANLAAEQANNDIMTLQKKLVAESQKEGSEMFSRFGI